MELPGFARRRSDLVWTRRGRLLLSHTPDVTISAKSAWYWRRRWTVTGVSSLALPVDVTLFIAKSGGAHGYWRNAPPGIAGYFGYSDTPALMPILVRSRTRSALATHDSPSWSGPSTPDTREPVELHVHERSIETETTTDDSDESVLDDQLAIHQALAADHADVLASWHSAAEELRGIVAQRWPPILTVPRAFGATTIALRWSSGMQGAATIELTADARGAKLWLIEREASRTPASISLAGRPFLAVGEMPIALDKLARVAARAEILSIIVRRHVTVRIAQHEPDAEKLEAVLELIGSLCGSSSEPYR